MKFNRLPALFFLTTILLGQELFDPYDVHTLDIEFYNPDYDSILQAKWEVDDKTYELATVIFNGEQMDSVGVRYKGNSTFWWAQIIGSPKFPLNIDFDLIYEDQDLMGYNKVKLSNSIFDPTFVKESTGYLTEGYYLSTPEVGYMNVSVNGELLGLYVAVETVSKQFLSKHFGNNTGAFFKCEPQFHYGEEYDADPDMVWYGNDSTEYAYQMGYELKSESGWNELLDLIYTLNFDIDDIESILNVDRALWYFAVFWWCLGVVLFLNWNGFLSGNKENKFYHEVEVEVPPYQRDGETHTTRMEEKENWGFFLQFVAVGVLTPFLIAGLWKAAMKRRKEEKSPIIEDKEK